MITLAIMIREPARPPNQFSLQSHCLEALQTNFRTRQQLYLGSVEPSAVFCLKKKSPSLCLIRAESRQGDDGGWISKLPPLSVIHSQGDVVGGKYKILSLLGQGGLATTYEAEGLDGERVALKAISLRSIKGWKELDLFEREARVLKSLRHPGIPEYIDYFEVDSAMDRAFYIVQMVAKGRSLADLIQTGWRATEQDVKRIAVEVLEILQYLGSLRPPVIHRDVKPENIILDEATGAVKLVDFGAVQDAAAVTIVGSTVVGTYGYMAPEQFQNRATVLSDLYGLGCTILFLISGKPPSSFPQKRLRIEFQDSLIAEPDFRRVLERLLEPAPEDRFQRPKSAFGTWIPLLLYADDIVLIAESPDGMQRQLDVLQKFAEESGLSVNMGKIKTKVFNTTTQWVRRLAPKFTYGQDNVEYTDAYTYLGVVFTGPKFALRTWVEPIQELGTKMAFYRGNFLQVSEDGFVTRPSYMDTHLSHGLRCATGQIRTSSNQLEIEFGRFQGIPPEDRLCKLCGIEPETELHYVCHCTVYYEIRGRFHCLFKEGFGPLDRVMKYEDQRCLGLYLLEIHRHRITLLRRQRTRQNQRQIKEFFRSNEAREEGKASNQQPMQRSVHSHTTGTLVDRANKLGKSRRPRPRCRSTLHRRRLQQKIRNILARHPS
ncbi:hypothetical protein L7F22_053525 [Adiantum nelumboides]|nr:hypothetical protein [Adiantum nelumboides]